MKQNEEKIEKEKYENTGKWSIIRNENKQVIDIERPTIKSQAFFEKNKKIFQEKNKHHK